MYISFTAWFGTPNKKLLNFISYHCLDLAMCTNLFTLIHVQYLQNVVFSFEKGSNRQNYFSSDSYHQIKDSPPSKFPISPNPQLYLEPQRYLENPELYHTIGKKIPHFRIVLIKQWICSKKVKWVSSIILNHETCLIFILQVIFIIPSLACIYEKKKHFFCLAV